MARGSVKSGEAYRHAVAWEKVFDEFGVKTTSNKFVVDGHPFVLDVYGGGIAESHRDSVAVYARYVGRKKEVWVRVELRVSNPGNRNARVAAPTTNSSKKGGGPPLGVVGQQAAFSWTSDPTRLGRRAEDGTRTRVGTEALCPIAAAKEVETLSVECAVTFVGSGESVRAKKAPGFATDSETLLKKSSSLTQTYRNLKFSVGIAPIVLRYASARRQARGVRKRLKKVDEAAYYDERTLLWDQAHEREAVHIRRLFEKMGGLYNKLAQDFATRDNLLPAPWVYALRGSFEALEPRPWHVMERCFYDGLADEGVDFVNASAPRGSLERYFADFDRKPLAAASIGQVHVGTLYPPKRHRRIQVQNDSSSVVSGRVVVKAIYPEIRKNLVADLANARRAAHVITTVLKLPMKGSVDAIMDENCESFPRELDLRLEAANIRKARDLFAKHGLDVRVPEVVEELSSSKVMTQTFCKGMTLAALFADDDDDSAAAETTTTTQTTRSRNLTAAFREKALEDVKTVAFAIGTTMFEEKWFHADPHPGNVMLSEDDPPALIDWGQCTSLSDTQLRTICHIVLLLATQSPALIDAALRQTDFNFNTDQVEHRMALLYLLFDSSREIDGVVSREAVDYLTRAIRYTPKRMPVLTDVPREMVFYGRVVSTLRKSFDALGADVSVVAIWKPLARAALKNLNAADPDLTSTALLLLPDEPAGLVVAIGRAPDVVQSSLNVLSRFFNNISGADVHLIPALRDAFRKSVGSTTDLGGSVGPGRSSPRFLRNQETTRLAASLVLVFVSFIILAGPLIRGLIALVRVLGFFFGHVTSSQVSFFAVCLFAAVCLAPPLPFLQSIFRRAADTIDSSSSISKPNRKATTVMIPDF